MIYAIYRCLYGETYVQESLKSIDQFVDKIFIFWDDSPWGNVTSCVYKNQQIEFPKKFDNVLDKIKELNNPKIELQYDHVENNVNQFTHLINDKVLPNYKKPDLFIIIEIDHVFKQDQLEKSIELALNSETSVVSTKPIELWKTYEYRIPERRRLCTIFWNMKTLDKLPNTHRHADTHYLKWIDTYTHNFGFAMDYNTTFYKHLTALGFSQKIGDDPPNEEWYDKWLNWTIDGPLNRDLEISKGYESNISHAYEYPFDELPEIIKDKYEIK